MCLTMNIKYTNDYSICIISLLSHSLTLRCVKGNLVYTAAFIGDFAKLGGIEIVSALIDRAIKRNRNKKNKSFFFKFFILTFFRQIILKNINSYLLL